MQNFLLWFIGLPFRAVWWIIREIGRGLWRMVRPIILPVIGLAVAYGLYMLKGDEVIEPIAVIVFICFVLFALQAKKKLKKGGKK